MRKSLLISIIAVVGWGFCPGDTSFAKNEAIVTRIQMKGKHYDQSHIGRIALPLGGIGTGTVSLGGRGDLRDWEIMNRPAKGFTPVRGRIGPFFALYAKTADGQTVARAIEGPIELSSYEGSHGATLPNHGLPRFRNCSFAAAYPLGQVHLVEPGNPGEPSTRSWPVRFQLTFV